MVQWLHKLNFCMTKTSTLLATCPHALLSSSSPPSYASESQDMMAHNILLNSTASSQYNAGGVRQRSGSRTECALLEFAQSLMALEGTGISDTRRQGARVLQVR